MLSLLGWVWRAVRAVLEWAGLVAAQEAAGPGQARVVVRLQGRSTELQLDPAWTVRDVKQRLVAQLGSRASNESSRKITITEKAPTILRPSPRHYVK